MYVRVTDFFSDIYTSFPSVWVSSTAHGLSISHFSPPNAPPRVMEGFSVDMQSLDYANISSLARMTHSRGL